MKKIVTAVLVIVLLLTGNASAFEITGINTDTSFTDGLNRDISSDQEYLRSIATVYGDRYIVREAEYADITSIDKLFEGLSEPLTLEEIDSGQIAFKTETVYSDRLKKEWNLFKMIGGLSGCRAVFEPVIYINVYRNITLVGGYTRYSVSYEHYDAAYWQCVCSVEDMTKEIIPFETRLTLLDKTRQMYENIATDKRFKVFLLVDGKINSVWERDTE